METPRSYEGPKCGDCKFLKMVERRSGTCLRNPVGIRKDLEYPCCGEFKAEAKAPAKKEGK